MDERHHEDTEASVQLHVYMCIDEMTRLVNRRVVLDLPRATTTSDGIPGLIMLARFAIMRGILHPHAVRTTWRLPG